MAVIKGIIITATACVVLAILSVLGAVGFLAFLCFMLGAFVYNVSKHI